VRIDLRVTGGNGVVVHPGEPVALSFRVDQDAYVAVCAIDARGAVQLLHPRRGDGWVASGHRVQLQARDLAGVTAGAPSSGVVYVEAVASPTPFDWQRAGIQVHDDCLEGWSGETAWRVRDDPLVTFNEINRALLGSWEEATFAVDHVWLHVGRVAEHPSYLCGVCAGRHQGYHDSWARVGANRAWEWQRSARYCRAVFRPLYVYREDRRALRHVRDEPSGNRSPFSAGSEGGRVAKPGWVGFESVHGAEVKEVARRGATQHDTPSDLRPARLRAPESRAVAGGFGSRAPDLMLARRPVRPAVPSKEDSGRNRQRAASGS
jgi:hypothetical protein